MTEQPRKRSLASDAAMLTVGLLFAQAASILTLSLLARLVPKEQLATYQQLTLLYGIIAPLMFGGIPMGLLFFLPKARSDAERGEWIAQAYGLLLSFGLVAMVLVIALRDPLAQLMGNEQLAPALLLYSPFLLSAFIASATPYALVASGRPIAAAIVNAIGGATTLIGAVTAALIRPDARALALGLACGGTAWAALSVIIVKRTVGISVGRHRQVEGSWRALLRYGVPLALSAVAARIGYQADRVVVAANFAVAQFAIYALGAVEIPISLLVQQSTTSVLVPPLARMWGEGDVPSMTRLWGEAMRKTTLLIAPMFAFLMVAAPDFIRVLFGDRYAASVPIFRIYLLLLPLRIATWSVMTVALGRTRVNWPVAVVMVIGNIAIALSLVAPLGLEGPALAAPVTVFASTVYYLLWTRVALGVRIRDLVPFRNVVSIFAVCGLSGLIVLPVLLLSIDPLLRFAIASAVFGLCCLALLRVTGLIRDDDWNRVLALAVKLRRAPVVKMAAAE